MTLAVWNQLTKPRVSFLVIATVIPGLYLGTQETPSLKVIMIAIFGTYLMSSASFIFNQYIEREKDALMYRTKLRPIPAGLVSPKTALLLGFALCLSAFAILYFFLNLLTAICALSALLAYIWLYTIVLKPRTDQNIVIGGVSGCVGPLIGYAAVSNSLPLPAWILFLMIFFWTPAHFWALAIFLKEDYMRAEIPMLPVVKGVEQTTRSIFLYTLLYSLTCFLFYFVHEGMGMFFLLSTGILTIFMIGMAVHLMKNPNPLFARKFFYFSILHLFLETIVITVDARMFA